MIELKIYFVKIVYYHSLIISNNKNYIVKNYKEKYKKNINTTGKYSIIDNIMKKLYYLHKLVSISLLAGW